MAGAAEGGEGASDSLPFADVRPSDWFYESALWCYERSVLKGTGKGFEPKAPVSHAMLWQVLYQTAGETGRGEMNAEQEAAPAAAAQASQGSASA